jgi:hypothetical protein
MLSNAVKNAVIVLGLSELVMPRRVWLKLAIVSGVMAGAEGFGRGVEEPEVCVDAADEAVDSNLRVRRENDAVSEGEHIGRYERRVPCRKRRGRCVLWLRGFADE